MAVVLLCGIVLQACDFGGDNDGDPSPTTVATEQGEAAEATTKPNTGVVALEPGESMTNDQLLARAQAAIGEYTWPANYYPDLPGQFAAAPQEAKEAGYEQGFEYSMLNGINSCAWTLTWADARESGDAAVQAEALDVMTTVLPNQPGVAGSPSVLQGLTEMAAKAALGDPTMVNQYVSANCDGIIWRSTT